MKNPTWQWITNDRAAENSGSETACHIPPVRRPPSWIRAHHLAELNCQTTLYDEAIRRRPGRARDRHPSIHPTLLAAPGIGNVCMFPYTHSRPRVDVGLISIMLHPRDNWIMFTAATSFLSLAASASSTRSFAFDTRDGSIHAIQVHAHALEFGRGVQEVRGDPKDGPAFAVAAAQAEHI